MESGIVDCDLLEAAKENVQPLAIGRRVTALSEILATPHAQREAKLAATRNRLRINVELALEDEDGDPLEAYCRLVYWTVENYPQGHSAESGLLELLEEATRALKDKRGGKWRGDLKYLKLWLLYASYVDKPTIIYKFLIANEIGTQHALLYEEHAAVLERDGRRREADDAYALGIARKAQPLEHLESRHQDFQKRMMSNTSLPAPQPATSSRPPRQALAQTSVASSTVPSRASPSNNLASSSSSPALRNNTRLQIFVDPTGQEAQSATLPNSNNTNEWNDLGTRKTRIKENAPEVKKMAGSTIKQPGKSKRLAAASASGAGVAPISEISVFRDPAPGDVTPPPVPSSSQKSPRSGSGLGMTSAKGFIPFVDAEPKENPVVGDSSQQSATGTFVAKFTPFRDESAVSYPAAVVPIATSIMKTKKADSEGPEPTSEAEALRKDPLRNYPQESLGFSLQE